MGWFTRRNKPCPGCGELAEKVRELSHTVHVLERETDDLHDRFRRFQGRTAKRAAVDGTESEGQGTERGSASNGSGKPVPAQLKAAGRWPYGRQ